MNPDDNKQNTNNPSDNNAGSNPLNTNAVLNRINNSVPNTDPSALTNPQTPVRSIKFRNSEELVRENNPLAKDETQKESPESTPSQKANQERYDFQSSKVLQAGIPEPARRQQPVAEKPEERPGQGPKNQSPVTAALREIDKKEIDFDDPVIAAMNQRDRLAGASINNVSTSTGKVKDSSSKKDEDELKRREKGKLKLVNGNIQTALPTVTQEDEKKSPARRKRTLRFNSNGVAAASTGGGGSAIGAGSGSGGGGLSSQSSGTGLINRQKQILEARRKKIIEERKKQAEKTKEKIEDDTKKDEDIAPQGEQTGQSKVDGQVGDVPKSHQEELQDKFRQYAKNPQALRDDFNNLKQKAGQLQSGLNRYMGNQVATQPTTASNAITTPRINGAGFRGLVGGGRSGGGCFGVFQRMFGAFFGVAAPLFFIGIIVLAIMGIVIAMISLATTANVTAGQNTTGQARSFFIRYDIDGQAEKGFLGIAKKGNPVVVEYYDDSTDNRYIRSINFALIYNLYDVNTYNERYLGTGSAYHVQVENISVNFQVNGISEAGLRKAIPYLSIPGVATGSYPTVGRSGNTFVWQPVICSAQAQSSSYQNKRCLSNLPEEAYFTFDWGPNGIRADELVPDVNAQVSIQSNPGITLGNYLVQDRQFLGLFNLVDPVGAKECMNLFAKINPGFIACTDNIEAGDALNGGGGVTGQISGEVASGCPFAYGRSEGEFLKCTAGYFATVGLNGLHKANDVVVVNSSQFPVVNRSLLSPVKGRVVATNSDNPNYYNKCGLFIEVEDEANPGTIYKIHHLDPTVYLDNDNMPKIGDAVGKDQNLGGPFNPPGGGSREYGTMRPCWTGVHIHFAIEKNGQAVDPQNFIQTSCNEQRFRCN